MTVLAHVGKGTERLINSEKVAHSHDALGKTFQVYISCALHIALELSPRQVKSAKTHMEHAQDCQEQPDT